MVDGCHDVFIVSVVVNMIHLLGTDCTFVIC